MDYTDFLKLVRSLAVLANTTRPVGMATLRRLPLDSKARVRPRDSARNIQR